MTGAVPVPESGTAIGVVGDPLEMLSEPARAPVAVGLNVMLIEHPIPAPSDAGQLLLAIAKSPVIVTDEIDSGDPPVLVSVTVCEPLVTPTRVAAKVSRAGLTD